jgi:apolipoprotein N-acyltransferase
MDRVIKTYGKIVRLHPSGFWPGFIIGLVYFSYIFSWIWAVSPANAFEITNKPVGLFLIFVVFSITVATAAIFWGLFSFFGRRIVRGQTNQYIAPLYLASVFVLVEYLRAWGMGLVWLGNGSFLGPHWTFGNPAYLLSFLPWIVKTSSVWGIYGIDFLIIFLLSSLALGIKKEAINRRILLGEILLIPIILLTANSITPDKQQGTPLTVSVIQTEKPAKINYSPEELLTSFGQENTLLKSVSKNSDIVIFPETANFSQTLSEFLNPTMVQKYFSSLNPKNILVVDSNSIPEADGLKSKVLFVDSQNGIAGTYDKKLLSPMGEFLPYIFKLPLSFFKSFNNNNFSTPEFTPGSGSNIVSSQDNRIKLLVCSDIVSPSLGQEGVFDFMIALSSLGIFNGNNRIANEMVDAARFRATENGKYLILASNYNRSYIINPDGQIEKSTPENGYQILTASIVPNKTRTWYNRLGDLPILLLSLAIFGLGFKNYLHAKQD